MKKYISLIILIVIVLFFSSCADVQYVNECLVDSPSGFWAGLWHGITAPFSLIASLFDDEFVIYAVNNNGVLYDLGYVLGIGGLGFGSNA